MSDFLHVLLGLFHLLLLTVLSLPWCVFIQYFLTTLVRYHGHIHPVIERADDGEMVKFKCTSDVDVQWKFNSGRLPNNVLSHNEENSDVYTLTVFVDGDSNYGFYACEGEIFDEDMAFYDIAVLVKKSKY